MIMNRFLQRLPRLSYRAKVAMLLVCGVVVGLGGLFLYLLRFHTYLGDDPSACVNCHIMTPYYATWMHGAHARNTTCNDCHVPHDNVFRKYFFKGKDGMNHVYKFVTRQERQAIQAIDESAEVIMENCVRCHATLNTELVNTGRITYMDAKCDEGKACWTCKSPDVPRIMKEKGIAEFYKAPWSQWGPEIVNTIGCSDCHDARTMKLKPARPALYEAFERRGEDVSKQPHQHMRSLVCAQCHTEYYFKGDGKYLTFPHDKGFTVEDIEAYYDEMNYSDYTHKISRAPILKAQHPDYELWRMGIHGQRGVSCADCHMPYVSEGGVKYSDHQITSPLAKIDKTCQTCHREDAETLRQNVYERQRMANDVRNRVEKELAKAHIEAKYAWDNGATEAEMKDALQSIRKSQWRWDFAVASHGASFHAPQEVTRILGQSLGYAQEARLAIAKVLARHGFSGDVPMPDISTKEKAWAYIGVDGKKLQADKAEFMKTVVPKWVQSAKAQGKLIEL